MSLAHNSTHRSSSNQSRSRLSHRLSWIAIGLSLCGIVALLRFALISQRRYANVLPSWAYDPPPLVMKGGDPYVRALMRTISASEANYARPYSVLYGGRRIDDLSQHPNQCLLIMTGPNKGDCTTAAGRYQFLTQTWLEKAEKYHPERSLLWIHHDYPFDPEFQDEVVYHWLMDTSAWNMDVSTHLRAGELDVVLKRLSGTWTSLGYGLETNSVSPKLPRIYEKMLDAELAIANF